ncbi:hypothetical protein Ahy_B01g057024 isoform C [Arachis hypogaea]|uniref:Uncharacterized protein n=1 Tax=Arachis hypogaea TaxID=3818 RepID=A0A445B075_ARAHY|nr:hypothetical protein Ahy_B01g057024 isoform C [Arachis hypogaea]
MTQNNTSEMPKDEKVEEEITLKLLPLKRQQGTTFAFLNCVKLEEESCFTILKDAIVRAEAQQPSPRLEESKNEEFIVVDYGDGFLSEHDVSVGKASSMSFNKSRHYHAKYSEEYADSHPLKERDAGFFSRNSAHQRD